MPKPIIWTEIEVRLGDLQPWEGNPRESTEKQVKAIQESLDEFGQVHPIAVGPDLEVYDGHQRLNAWLHKYGPDFRVRASQSSRKLTESERRRLVLRLHNKAAGQWTWDVLASWPAEDLEEGGFDADAFRQASLDAMNVKHLIESQYGEFDPWAEWQDMPEFSQEDQTAFRTIKIHFQCQEDLDEFADLVSQVVTEKTKYLWFPPKERAALRKANYVQE